MRRRTAAPLLTLALLTFAACGGDDAESTDATTAPSADTAAPSGGSTDDAATSGELTVTGRLQIDAGAADSTMCVYIDDAAQGRVFLSPTGEFEGFFRSTTDGSDPDYLVELVDTSSTVLIAKGASVTATGVTDGPEARCTQGDQVEISVTSLVAE